MLAALVALLATADSLPVRLASPGFSLVGLSDQKGALFVEHLNKQLELRGVSVTGKNDIAALLGLERQKQLLGCSDEQASCLAELAGALGVDGLLTGSLGKVGNGYVVEVK